jgi:hypothetical protein
MERRLSRFAPKANEEILLFGERYIVQAHPSIPHLPFSSEGRRALVCQLKNRKGEYYAFKVFKKKYRDQTLVSSASLLLRVESFEGMRAAKRRIVMPGDSVLKSYSNLEYAMLMPWVSGTTWFDILQRAAKDGFRLLQPDAIRLCQRFLKVLDGLEAAGIAHTDISAGNVAVDLKALDVQLLDLEDLFITGASAPPHQNAGSKGYRHHTCDIGKTCWCPEGDRYAAAILAAEILILTNEKLARKSTEDGFFIGHCRSVEGNNRFREAKAWLKTIAPGFSQLFESAWNAGALVECPKIATLRAAVDEVVRQTPRATRASAEQPQRSSAVEWKPLPLNLTPRRREEKTTSPVVWVNGSAPEQKRVLPLDKPQPRRAATAVKIIAWTTIMLIIIRLIIYLSGQ